MDAQKELLDAMQILIDNSLKKITQIYYGSIVSVDSENHSCVILMNGREYTMPYYGNQPTVNLKYPVVAPQGNLSIGFVIG